MGGAYVACTKKISYDIAEVYHRDAGVECLGVSCMGDLTRFFS